MVGSRILLIDWIQYGISANGPVGLGMTESELLKWLVILGIQHHSASNCWVNHVEPYPVYTDFIAYFVKSLLQCSRAGDLLVHFEMFSPGSQLHNWLHQHLRRWQCWSSLHPHRSWKLGPGEPPDSGSDRILSTDGMWLMYVNVVNYI